MLISATLSLKEVDKVLFVYIRGDAANAQPARPTQEVRVTSDAHTERFISIGGGGPGMGKMGGIRALFAHGG